MNACAACGKAEIQQQCKICKAYLYCSRDCVKKGTKAHKKSCPKLAIAIQSNIFSEDDPMSTMDVALLTKHSLYMLQSKIAAVADKGGQGASEIGGLNPAAELAAESKRCRAEILEAKAAKEEATLHADESNEELAAQIRAYASALGEMKGLDPGRYGDAAYWEERHAGDRRTGHTYEWYTDYPEEALRQAFPPSARGGKTLVVGCGNSELSERMCADGFRDVLSVDTSVSAVAQMMERAPKFNTSDTKCSYKVMDATQLALGTGTVAGVVDKGTIDAALSGGLQSARGICQEAMRVLAPGGKFLVISNSPGNRMLDDLLGMCGPGSSCDAPLSVAAGKRADDPCVYAYIVRKAFSLPAEVPARHKSKRPATPASAPPAQAPVEGTIAAVAAQERELLEELVHEAFADPPLQGQELLQSLIRGVTRPLHDEAKTARRDAAVVAGSTMSVKDCEVSPTPAPYADGSNNLESETKGTERMAEPRGKQSSSVSVGAGSNGNATARDREVVDPVWRAKPTLLQEAITQQSEHVARCEAALMERGAKSAGAPETAEGGGMGKESCAPAVTVPSLLPFGARESFSQDDEYANYELGWGVVLDKSKLSVEIGAKHLKISYGPSGARTALLDCKLYDTIDIAESTWSIQDKKLLSVNLCKRARKKWTQLHKAFDSPATIRNGTSTRETKIVDLLSSKTLRDLSAKSLNNAVFVTPRTGSTVRERVPAQASVVFDSRDVVTPKRYLLEDQTGIKTFQIHVAKPPGLEVIHTHVEPVAATLCELRLVCRDEANGGNRAKLLIRQRVELGRGGFSPSHATLIQGEAASDSLCIVRLPYDDENRNRHGGDPNDLVSEPGAERAGAALNDPTEFDDEGVSRIAHLRCRFCGNRFTSSADTPSLVVRAMPSGRWDECIEEMTCFDGPSAVPMLARDVNFASAGRCLMGHAEVLIHSRDVTEGAVTLVSPGENGESADDESSMATKDGVKRCSGLNSEKVGARDYVFDSDPEEHDSEQGWRRLECSRCNLPLGRPAALPHARSNGGEDCGLLLLKHCLLGDDLGSAPNTARGVDKSVSGDGVEIDSEGLTVPDLRPPPSPAPQTHGAVFEKRTVIKWLMAEMDHAKEADGCARFILTARGRHRAAPLGCLSLLLVGTHNRVSVDGRGRPERAYRIAYREESRVEADEAAAKQGRRGEEEATPTSAGKKMDGAERRHGAGRLDQHLSAEARERVPARVLEVSYGEYSVVREKIVGAAWASEWTKGLPPPNSGDPVGKSYSYLF